MEAAESALLFFSSRLAVFVPARLECIEYHDAYRELAHTLELQIGTNEFVELANTTFELSRGFNQMYKC